MKRGNIFLFLAFVSLILCFKGANAQKHEADSTKDVSESLVLIPHYGFVKVDSIFANPLSSVHQVDKAMRTHEGFYQYLSTPGSPSRNLFLKLQNPDKHRYLPDLFEPYTYSDENIHYYRVSKPHSNLRYSSDINSSQYFTISHTQNLIRNWNIGLTYDVNYADGTFAKSQVMNQFFNLTSNYISPNQRYVVAASFIRNRAYVLENGGIESDSLFLGQLFSKPETYPVNLQNAYSKYKTAEYSLYQSFNLCKDEKDKIGIFNRGKLSHKIDFSQIARIYQDENLVSADSFATRSLRNNISWTNLVDYATALPVSIGLKHELLMYSDKVNSPIFNIMTPYAEISFRSTFITASLFVNKTFGSDFYAGDYSTRFSTTLFFGRSMLNLTAERDKQSNHYFYLHFANENLEWNLPSEKTTQSSLKLSYLFGDMFSFNADWLQFDNRPKISSEDLSISYSDLINVYRLYMTLNKEWKHLGLKNICVLQHNDNQEYLHLPVFMAKQSIYVKFGLFGGKLETAAGLDLRYNTSYHADEYLPQLGVFAYQDKEKYGNYVYCDLFVNARIDQCNVFLALTHPYAGLFGYNYIPTPLYPNEGLSFRWGLSWNFVN